MIKRSGVVAAAIWFLALLVMGSSASAQGDRALKKIVFLTNYSYNGRHSPFFVGIEKGYYKDAGFEMEVQPSTGGIFVATALDAGKADYGIADPSAVVQSIVKGAKIKAFGVYVDVSTTGLASTKPYPRIESLSGKVIGTALTDSTRVMVPLLMKLNGLDPSKVMWETADPSVYAALLLSNKVDFISATSDGDIPNLNRIAKPRGTEVYFTPFADWGYDVFGYLLLTQSKRIEQNPEEVKSFAAATVKAVNYAIAHPDEAADAIVKHNPTLDRNTILTQWQLSIKAFDTPYVRQHGYGVATTDRVKRTIDLVKGAFNVQGDIKPEDVYVPGFIQP